MSVDKLKQVELNKFLTSVNNTIKLILVDNLIFNYVSMFGCLVTKIDFE